MRWVSRVVFWYGQAAVFGMDDGLVLSAGMGRTAGWLNQELRGGEGWEGGWKKWEDGRCHAGVNGVKWEKSTGPRCGKDKESKGYGYYILCLEEFGVSEKERVSGVWSECLFFALNPCNFFTIWINVPRFVQEIHFFGKMTT